MDPVENFIQAWQCFFENLGANLSNQESSFGLQEAIDLAIAELRSDETIAAISEAIAQEDEIIVQLLALEMNYFCNLGVSGGGYVLNKADIIKSSIERLIRNLPQKVKDLLDIVNELIRLVA